MKVLSDTLIILLLFIVRTCVYEVEINTNFVKMTKLNNWTKRISLQYVYETTFIIYVINFFVENEVACKQSLSNGEQ